MKRDKAGRLMPSEPQCHFRREMRKRTPVDGFARDDIFYIHPDGRTTEQCFHEVKYQLSECAPIWFRAQNDLENLLSRIRSAEEFASASDLDTYARPGSYSWNALRSVLLLVKHQQSPTQHSAGAALDSINQAMGAILDFSTILVDREVEERYAVEMRELWEQLGTFRPVPVCSERSVNAHCCLDGPIWATASTQQGAAVGSPNSPIVLSPRKQFWPGLKSVGFSEFTDRRAHRVSKHLVEVVELLPMDPAERRASNLPTGLFRIGIGVFWPVLGEDRLLMKYLSEAPKPTVNECHVSNWLAPKSLSCKEARTAFNSIEDASAALAGPALGWLEIFRNHDSALSLLQQKDWELFWCFPMMRGYGASSSSRRLVYIALLKYMLGKSAEAEEYIKHAEAALHTWYPEHLHLRYRAWMDLVKSRICEIESPSSTGPQV